MKLQFSILFVFIGFLIASSLADQGWHKRQQKRRRIGAQSRNVEENQNTQVQPLQRRSNRRHRQIHRFPRRDERSRMNCRVYEHWVRCGPEPHCEVSCDNLSSPPHCRPVEDHPKCFYPRCVCDDDFVRDRDGFCVRDWKCSEGYGDYEGDSEDTGYRFRKQHRKRFW